MASRTAATAASAPAMLICRHLISSGVLTARTARISPWQSRTSQPRFSSASACRWLQRSSPIFIEPPPCVLHEVGDLVGERTGRLVVAAGDRRPDQLARPRLVDRVEHHADMIALRIFEQDDRPFGRHEEIARRVAQEIAEHVARAGGVALVVGIEQHDGAVAGLASSRRAASPGGPSRSFIGVDGRRLGVGQPHAVRRDRRRRMAHASRRNRRRRCCRDRKRRCS